MKIDDHRFVYLDIFRTHLGRVYVIFFFRFRSGNIFGKQLQTAVSVGDRFKSANMIYTAYHGLGQSPHTIQVWKWKGQEEGSLTLGPLVSRIGCNRERTGRGRIKKFRCSSSPEVKVGSFPST